MTAKNDSPIKFFWATTAFVLFMFIFIGLVLIYLQRPKLAPSSVNNTISQPSVSSLTPSGNLESTASGKLYQSKYNWKVIYPTEATIDTSVEKDSASLERLTISQLDSIQPEKNNGFYGYSVDFSVESKTGSLSNFADRDSLQNTTGKREFFAVTALGGKTGYKVLIKDTQEYTTYYLPLKETDKALIITTSNNGSSKEKWDEIVLHILESIELLD